MAGGAVGEIAVDERLVGQADLGGQLFEVPHGFDIQPNCNRLFELGRIGILRGCAEVIFVFHDRKLQYCVDSFFVAFRAEMIRISIVHIPYVRKKCKKKDKANHGYSPCKGIGS